MEGTDVTRHTPVEQLKKWAMPIALVGGLALAACGDATANDDSPSSPSGEVDPYTSIVTCPDGTEIYVHGDPATPGQVESAPADPNASLVPPGDPCEGHS